MSKSLVLKNTAANFLGKVVNRAVRILLVPLQIQLLGEEAFGLLGLYALLGGFIVILDFGLSFTGKREIARVATNGEQARQDIRNLIRTFEIPYWFMGLLIGCLVLVSAEWFTDNWITATTLPRSTVVYSVTIVGLLFVARWPVSLYSGFLYGLQRQVAANTLAISIEVLNGIGSIIVLLVRPDVESFFLWQLVVGIVEILAYTWLCWSSVAYQGAPWPKFKPDIFRDVWRYALGVNLISAISALFTRSDGLIVSRLLAINYLGYYSIAQRIPTLIGLVSGSILPATTPLMVAHHKNRDWSQLSRIYHRQARWLAFLSAGVAFPVAVFSYPILRLWTQSETIAEATWLALALISGVSALEITSNSVNQLSLASGFTRPPLIIGIVEGLVVTIGSLALIPYLGIVGAALSWTLARTIRYVLYPILVNRLVLHGEGMKWFLSDTLPIFGIGVISFGGGWALYHSLFWDTDNFLIWIPFALFAGITYVGTILILNFVPEWRQLPFLSRMHSGRLADS